MYAICEKCKAVFSTTGSYHPDHGHATVAQGHCNCPNVSMGNVLWGNEFTRPDVRRATDQEIVNWEKQAADNLIASAQKREADELIKAVSALIEYLENNLPTTLAFFRRETRRQGPTNRKRLHKAALVVSGNYPSVRLENLKDAFEKAVGYR